MHAWLITCILCVHICGLIMYWCHEIGIPGDRKSWQVGPDPQRRYDTRTLLYLNYNYNLLCHIIIVIENWGMMRYVCHTSSGPDHIFFLSPSPLLHHLEIIWLGWLARLDPAKADKLAVFHARGVILPPNRPHPTTHLHPPLFLFPSLTELYSWFARHRFFFEILVFHAGWLYTTWSGRNSSWVSTSVSFTLHHHLFAFLGLTGLTEERPPVVAIGSAGRLQYPTQCLAR